MVGKLLWDHSIGSGRVNDYFSLPRLAKCCGRAGHPGESSSRLEYYPRQACLVGRLSSGFVFTAVCKSHGGQAISGHGEKSSFTSWETLYSRDTVRRRWSRLCSRNAATNRAIIVRRFRERVARLTARRIITRIVIKNNESQIFQSRACGRDCRVRHSS